MGYASPFFGSICRELGRSLGRKWADLQKQRFTLVATASLAGHAHTEKIEKFCGGSTMSFDYHVTEGFAEHFSAGSAPCVHFKDTNSVLTGGDAWAVPHGCTVLLEAPAADHTNEAKEGALLSLAGGGLLILGGGGPTVAANLVRLSMVPKPAPKGVAVCGLHGTSLTSGASGLLLSESKMLEAIEQAVAQLDGVETDSNNDNAAMLARVKAEGGVISAVAEGVLPDLSKTMTAMKIAPNIFDSSGTSAVEPEAFPPVAELLKQAVKAEGFQDTMGSPEQLQQAIVKYCDGVVQALLELELA